jgi:hypothetical protein
VATTVIEVGVDVPNASLMIIENAERLGLAQLHQLRGRVGRGARSRAACCCTSRRCRHWPRAPGRDAQTNDGFVIAEKDLELRGPGELLGTRQTGLVEFPHRRPGRDADLLPLCRGRARAGPEADALLADSFPTDPGDDAPRLIARWIGVRGLRPGAGRSADRACRLGSGAAPRLRGAEFERWLQAGTPAARLYEAISRQPRAWAVDLRGGRWHSADPLAMALALAPGAADPLLPRPLRVASMAAIPAARPWSTGSGAGAARTTWRSSSALTSGGSRR